MKFLDWFRVDLIEVASAKQVKELEHKLNQQACEIVMLKGEIQRLTMVSSHLLDRPRFLTCLNEVTQATSKNTIVKLNKIN